MPIQKLIKVNKTSHLSWPGEKGPHSIRRKQRTEQLVHMDSHSLQSFPCLEQEPMSPEKSVQQISKALM